MDEEDLQSMGNQYGIMPTADGGQIEVQSQPAADDPALNMLRMLQSYNAQPTSYEQEIMASRQKMNESQQRFEDAVRASMSNAPNRPSKSELYFKMAQAFLSPGKTGSFLEGAGGAFGVAGQHAAEVRDAEAKQRQQQLATQAELAKFQLSNQKEDLATLRALDAGERGDRRAVQTKLLEQYIASGKPQSEAGKEALDAGYQRGTPEYNDFVRERIRQKAESGDLWRAAQLAIAQGNLALRQQKALDLTPHEMDIVIESQDQAVAAKTAADSLKRALDLNDKVFGSDLASVAQRKAMQLADPKNKKLQDTEDFENLILTQAAAQLKAIFGGNPTEGERAILLDLQGLGSKSAAARKSILERGFAAADARRKRAERRAKEVRSGAMRSRVPDDGEDAEAGDME